MSTHGLSHAGAQRAYVLHVPAARETEGAPLVVALHGRHQTPSSIRTYSGLEDVGAREGFVTAFPSALGGGWNAGTCCEEGSRDQHSDVELIDAVIEDVSKRVAIDRQRVHVVGFSNGGMLAYRYGCVRAGKVAGIGVVGGLMTADASYSRDGGAECAPRSPVSLFHLHGDQDRLVDQGGGYQESLQARTASAVSSVQAYAQAAGCQGSEESITPAVRMRSYGGCATSAHLGIRFVRMGAVGHEWTKASSGLDTSEAMWSFLAPQRASDLAGGAPSPVTPAGANPGGTPMTVTPANPGGTPMTVTPANPGGTPTPVTPAVPAVPAVPAPALGGTPTPGSPALPGGAPSSGSPAQGSTPSGSGPSLSTPTPPGGAQSTGEGGRGDPARSTSPGTPRGEPLLRPGEVQRDAAAPTDAHTHERAGPAPPQPTAGSG